MICIFTLIQLGLAVKDQLGNENLLTLVRGATDRSLPIVFAVVGALIISHQPRNRIGWLLMIPAISFVVSALVDAYLGRFTRAPAPTAAVLLMLWFQNWSWLQLMLPLFLILLLFPTGKPPSPRWRYVLGYALGMCAVFLMIVTFGQYFEANGAWMVPNPLGLIPDDPEFFATFLALWGLNLELLTILCAASLFIRYRRASAVERLQIKWLLFAGGVFVACYVPLLVWQGELQSLASQLVDFLFLLSVMLFPIAIGIAILRYRLYDIDVLINRALVYGSLTAMVIGLYVLVVGYLGALLRTQNNLAISLLATGLVAVLFQPLRDRLQLGVNRLMYGQRDEPVAVLSQLGARLEGTVVPNQILPGLVDTVAGALKLPYAAIALQVGDQFQVQAERGSNPRALEHFPLTYQGQTIGQLLVAPRAPGESFNPADRLLLTNIARQAGAVAHAVQLTAALQQSRQQLVTAREEERRRLRRDLHDGLGPQLASQTLTIDAIGKLMERDPGTARELLEHLKTQSQAAIQDIRRLVYNLRPPALDELGLVEALREGVRQAGQAASRVEIQTDPDPLPALPAAVEVAVYRIAQEAITNVLRHAQADHCTVSIAVQGQRVELSITDDGPGFPASFHFGVGLNSMRERAEELGGQIRFENRPEGGARVQGWLPLPGGEEG